MDTAKVFMTGRSQAVRLPKAYRFESDEVTIERQRDGALLLRPKVRRPLGERIAAVLRDLPDEPAFQRPEQPRLERDAEWWATHRSRQAPSSSKTTSQRRPGSRTKR